MWTMLLGDFQFQGILLIWMIVGQGPAVLAVGVVWGCLNIHLKGKNKSQALKIFMQSVCRLMLKPCSIYEISALSNIQLRVEILSY